MDAPVIHFKPTNWVLGTLLFCAACCATNDALAQAQAPEHGESQPRPRTVKLKQPNGARPMTRATVPRAVQMLPPMRPRGTQPSADYQESIRKTVERRRSRRAGGNRTQAMLRELSAHRSLAHAACLDR